LNLSKFKKIVWVAHESNKSGANLFLLEYVELLSKVGYNQLVIIPHRGNMQMELDKLGVASKVIHYYSWVRPVDRSLSITLILKRNGRNLIAFLNFVKLFFEFKPNVVFTNTSVINIGAIAAMFYKAKHLWYIHEMGEEDFNFKLPWGKFSYIFMNAVSHKLLTNSEHLRKKYVDQFDKINIEVLRNIVKVYDYNPVIKFNQGDTIKLLLLGQITEAKGHLIAIQAISLLRLKGYPVELSIVGTANDDIFFQKMKSNVTSLSLTKFIHYSGYSEDVSNLISNHHALLMCSKCEAFGRVTAEAMKIGIPVIGSNTCGTKELIDHKKTGMLFDTGSSQSLANEIKELFDNVNLREEIVIAAKQKIETLLGERHIVNFFNNEI
jgi:glycosyltransferase involved in cell wall biosynthesis